MKKEIWKFNTLLGELKYFTIKMPAGAELLTVQVDQKDNTPCIWALLDPQAKEEERYFELYGTGHEIYYDMGIERKYIGTYQYDNGNFVGHIFERLN